MANFRNETQATLGAANAEVKLGTRHFENGVAALFLPAGLTGSVLIEVTEDNVNWFPVAYTVAATGVLTSAATPITASGYYYANVPGALQVRARVSAYTSGSAVAQLVCQPN